MSMTIEWYKNFIKGINPKELSLKNIHQFMEGRKND
jgi:hypothetical protein